MKIIRKKNQSKRNEIDFHHCFFLKMVRCPSRPMHLMSPSIGTWKSIWISFDFQSNRLNYFVQFSLEIIISIFVSFQLSLMVFILSHVNSNHELSHTHEHTRLISYFLPHYSAHFSQPEREEQIKLSTFWLEIVSYSIRCSSVALSFNNWIKHIYFERSERIINDFSFPFGSFCSVAGFQKKRNGDIGHETSMEKRRQSWCDVGDAIDVGSISFFSSLALIVSAHTIKMNK